MLIDPVSGQPLDGAPLGALLSAQAEATPDAPALTFGPETRSFRQLEEAANRRARQLAGQGVTGGDTVVIGLDNRAEFPECAFATWKLGAVPCPISNRLAPLEFEAVVGLAAPRLILHDGPLSGETGPALAIGGPPPAYLSAAPLPPAIGQPGKIVGSGGSTGRPKLIVDPLPSVWGADKEVPGRGPRSTMLNASPLYHSGPFTISCCALAEGCHVVGMTAFDPEDWLALVERHRVNFAYVVPTIMTRIAKLDPETTRRANLSSLATVLHTAAPCSAETKKWWIERIGGRRILEIYGGAERIGATMIDGEEWSRHPGSVGRPMRGQSVLIIDEAGNSLPPGEIGEVRFRRLADAPERYTYIGADAPTRSLDGFGDMGWLDEDGFLFIADRRTDMMVVGGVNVYPAEIEAAIEAQSGVLGAAAIGLPDPDLGQRVHAIVELAANTSLPDQAEFIALLRVRLSGFKLPRSVEFVREHIRDDAGKVRRGALRAERIAAR